MNIEAATGLAIRGSPLAAAATTEKRVQPALPVEAHTTPPELIAIETPPNRVEGDPSREEAEQLTQGVNAFLQSSSSHIQFALHEGANRLMVQVIDNDTEEVIQTFPSKDLLDLATKIGEMVGTLLDRTS